MKKRKQTAPTQAAHHKPATLKDLLNPEVLEQLQAQANKANAEQDRRQAEERAQALAARKAEQKRLENDFEYLLNNSSLDWKKHK